MYAACDGIDAAYDCIIEGGTINIFTEKYSSYSGDVEVNSTTAMYLRISSRASGLNNVSKYSAMYILSDNSTVNYMKKEGKTYPIIDNNIGTSVYSNNILNGIKTILNIDVDYIVLNGFGIELSKFINVIELFKNVNKDNINEYEERINNMFNNVDNGFLNTKTIYRVKKNEK